MLIEHSNTAAHGGLRSWGLRLLAVFVVLLAAAGLGIWQHDNAQDKTSTVAQPQKAPSVPATLGVAVAEGGGLQVDAAQVRKSVV